MYAFTINEYCYRHHYFTVSKFQVISFIVSSFKSTIVRNYILLKYLTYSILGCTHIHTSSLPFFIWTVNFIRIPLKFLLWSQTFHCWNNHHHNQGKSIFLFKPGPSFIILHIITNMHDFFIHIYFYCHTYFTVCEVQVRIFNVFDTIYHCW